jgi:hypothetical protein
LSVGLASYVGALVSGAAYPFLISLASALATYLAGSLLAQTGGKRAAVSS